MQGLADKAKSQEQRLGSLLKASKGKDWFHSSGVGFVFHHWSDDFNVGKPAMTLDVRLCFSALGSGEQKAAMNGNELQQRRPKTLQANL